MRTNPVLARREIPRKERLQKALGGLAATVLAVVGAWVATGGSLDRNPGYLFAIGSIALLGLSVSLFLWSKKHEVGKTKEDSQFLRKRIEDDRHGSGWISRIGFNIRRLLAGIIVLVGGLFVLTGLGVFGLQLFGYLKYGEWKSMPFLDLVSPYFPWFRNPQSWFGLHDIVRDAFDILPVSFLLILVGLLVAGFGSALKGRVTR